jgi:hypothetical protein
MLGADDTVERRSGRQITAKGCYRDAVRSTVVSTDVNGFTCKIPLVSPSPSWRGMARTGVCLAAVAMMTR